MQGLGSRLGGSGWRLKVQDLRFREISVDLHHIILPVELPIPQDFSQSAYKLETLQGLRLWEFLNRAALTTPNIQGLRGDNCGASIIIAVLA